MLTNFLGLSAAWYNWLAGRLCVFGSSTPCSNGLDCSNSFVRLSVAVGHLAEHDVLAV
jgi:hypothetical protein